MRRTAAASASPPSQKFSSRRCKFCSLLAFAVISIVAFLFYTSRSYPGSVGGRLVGLVPNQGVLDFAFPHGPEGSPTSGGINSTKKAVEEAHVRVTSSQVATTGTVQVPTSGAKPFNTTEASVGVKSGSSVPCKVSLDSKTITAELAAVPEESTLVGQLKGTGIHPGGWWKPSDCAPRDRVAIVIPFRNREQHLLLFAKHMHPFLQRQKLEYAIYIVDQSGQTAFNRAMLLNIGFLEAMADLEWRCFLFHDVDHMPVDDGLSYSCGDQPVHMSEKTDKWNWALPYGSFVGGVTKQLASQVKKMNGFSNVFWGWGGEDDDILTRWRETGLKFTRPGGTGRYATIKIHHSVSSKPNPDRFKLLGSSAKRIPTDGLNSVQYHVEKKVRHALYTRIVVRVKHKV